MSRRSRGEPLVNAGGWPAAIMPASDAHVAAGFTSARKIRFVRAILRRGYAGKRGRHAVAEKEISGERYDRGKKKTRKKIARVYSEYARSNSKQRTW